MNVGTALKERHSIQSNREAVRFIGSSNRKAVSKFVDENESP